VQNLKGEISGGLFGTGSKRVPEKNNFANRNLKGSSDGKKTGKR